MKRIVAILALISLTFGALSTAATASTVRITVGADEWDLDTVTGTFDGLESVLVDQAWWGDVDLAKAFSAALGGSLGYPYSGYIAPFFAYIKQVNPDGSQWFGAAYYDRYSGTVGRLGTGGSGGPVTFAVATKVASVAPVPLPATAALFLAALGLLAGLGGLTRRPARASSLQG